MKNVFSHYGVEVIRQIISKRFISVLDQKGIEYTELPLVEHWVVSYVLDNTKKYALINPCGDNEYAEYVYTTTEVPFDGWDALVSDVEAQVVGEEPKKMSTRLRIVLDAAYKSAVEQVEASPSDSFIPDDTSEDKILEEMVYCLIHMGFDKSDLKRMDSSDVDQEYFGKVIGAFA